MKLSFLLRTALQHLLRGEGRTLAALACVAFGVMSLVALSTVSAANSAVTVVPPQYILGADLTLAPTDGDTLQPAHLAQLDEWQQAGVISRYLPIAESYNLLFRRPETGEVQHANGLGIDPAVYPLAGNFTLRERGVEPADVLTGPGQVIVTRDLAQKYDLAVGDQLILSDLRVGIAVPAVIVGIATDSPNHTGGKLYYHYATAGLLAGGEPPLSVAVALADDPAAAAAQAEAAHWSVLQATGLAEAQQEGRDLIDLLFKGSGLLGLMVGGIGIANTMQVLLRRRQREVAVWKTIGYTARDLYVLFALEALLLGVAGSLLGAVLGVAVSGALLELIARTGTFLLQWVFDLGVIVGAVLSGIATAVIFALWAIVAAARVPPMALLRQEAVSAARLPWPQAVGLAVVLAVPFTAVTSLTLESVSKGIGIVLFAVAGLIFIGGGLAALAWLAVRVLRVPGLPYLNLAQSNPQRRGLGLVFAMIALFTGIVALGLGVAVTRSAQEELAARTPEQESYELAVLAPGAEESAIREALSSLGLTNFAYGYYTDVESIRAGENHLGTLLVAQNTPTDYDVDGAPWGSVPDGVYVFQFSGVERGDTVTVTLADGTVHTFVVAGTYAADFTGLRPSLGLLLPAEASRALAAPGMVQMYIEAPARDAARLSAELGRALPTATVVNMLAYRARFVQSYRNLFLLAVTMAGLALLAGALLVANSVSLAMLDRRYEIGVLKAVGYTRRHVLATLVYEYGLLAVLATGAGLIFVQGLLWVLGLLNDVAARVLVLDPISIVIISLVGVGLTALTVLGATWSPTRVSPAVVLNDRG